MDTKTNAPSDTARREEAILAFWKEHRTFEKSLEKPAPRGEFVFYDGPPFATGLPHYGHLLAGTIKDVLPRYKTMRGWRVERRWGWDCHGLPIENLIEKELGLKNKKDIEELGVGVFNEAARASVLRYADEWKKIVPRFGRWVDMENDYRTMDPSYTESVWWIFAELYRKGLVYEGFKAMHLCPRCGTTLSNFEVAQGYRDITDLAVTVKLELADEPGAYLLVWTTTPWTLPGNMAAAVNPNLTYAAVRSDTGLFYVAKERVAHFFDDKAVEREVSGDELVGKSYNPPFPYYRTAALPYKENAWKVYAAPYVSAEEGTGIVHLAPAYGAEDLELAQRENIPVVHHVDKTGAFVSDITDFAGRQAKPKDDPQETDVAIIKYLAHSGALFKKEKITHSYPHCWRCETPLLNYATDSWFVAVSRFREKLVAENRTVRWVPPEVGEKRFGNWLEGARDWAISRPRYWGAPFPVWRHPKTGAVTIVGSLDELKKKTKTSGNRYVVMRHAEAKSNAGQFVSAEPDEENTLTEKGEEQARRAGARLAAAGTFDLIVASPLARTKQTAEIVAAAVGYSKEKIVYDPRIREFNFGHLDHQPVAELHSYWGSYEAMFTKAAEGGETLADMRHRLGEFLYELEREHENKRILIVGHEYTSWLLEAIAEGADRRSTIAMKRNASSGRYDNAEVRPLDFTPLPHNADYELDFHRPYIDDVQLVDESGEALQRIPDVFDSWFESGSMPYAQKHYPFDSANGFNPKGGWFKARRGFPADFIAEGLDQTRGWFYSLMVLGMALFGVSPYKNVIVNGLTLAEDGKKMSKSLRNYPDPMEVVRRYGADAVRYYLLSSPIVRAEDLRFTEKDVAEVSSKLIGRLVNVLSLYELYKDAAPHGQGAASSHVLDRWILSRLNQTVAAVEAALEAYELDRAARPLFDFVDDLSAWYARRSRDRLRSGATDTLATLRFVLKTYAQVAAPFIPFVAEHVFRAVRADSDEESVHLAPWPSAGKVDAPLSREMALVRTVVSRALELRSSAGIKVRQPLEKLTVKSKQLAGKSALLALITDEVNVKEVVFDEALGEEAALDMNITPELKEEGDVRELLRAIQDLRKAALLAPRDSAVLVMAGDTALLEKYWSDISRAANLERFEKGKEAHVRKS